MVDWYKEVKKSIYSLWVGLGFFRGLILVGMMVCRRRFLNIFCFGFWVLSVGMLDVRFGVFWLLIVVEFLDVGYGNFCVVRFEWLCKCMEGKKYGF